MKDKIIQMKRDVWDYFRGYRRAPFQKRYLEIEKVRDMSEKTNSNVKLFRK